MALWQKGGMPIKSSKTKKDDIIQSHSWVNNFQSEEMNKPEVFFWCELFEVGAVDLDEARTCLRDMVNPGYPAGTYYSLGTKIDSYKDYCCVRVNEAKYLRKGTLDIERVYDYDTYYLNINGQLHVLSGLQHPWIGKCFSLYDKVEPDEKHVEAFNQLKEKLIKKEEKAKVKRMNNK